MVVCMDAKHAWSLTWYAMDNVFMVYHILRQVVSQSGRRPQHFNISQPLI